MSRMTLALLSLAAVLWMAQPAAAQVRMEVDAIAGQPYGVGYINLQAEPGARMGEPGSDSLSLRDRNGRVFYPAYAMKPVRQLLRNLLGAPPRRMDIFFLFQGNAPLELTLYTPAPVTRTITPRQDSGVHSQMLAAWWQEYNKTIDKTNDSGDFPPLVNQYLTSMLGRKLQMPPYVSRRGEQTSTDISQADSVVGLLLGTETVRLHMQREMWSTSADAQEKATLPLPAGPPELVREFPEMPAEVPIETIAGRVPVECFYARFGSFENFQWYRERNEAWGGDLRNILSKRGLEFGVHAKMEKQLALKESALSKILGPQVIADVAMIGTDFFMREGAAIGMLFQAKNSFALSADFIRQRAESKVANPGTVEEQVDVDGKQVSYLHSPDGAVRSYYAVDGDFHFVTTSKSLARRFLQTAKDDSSLGKSREFRYARTLMPLDRQDTLFAYLSDAMFRNLAGPQYRIEMERRMRSAIEMELAQVGQLAARSEGAPHTTIQELVSGGYVPPCMLGRSDGSRLIFENGHVADSLRGERGLFVPIPDVPIDGITPNETRKYNDFARLFNSDWGQIDPIVAAVKRSPSQRPGLEHITIDVKASPISPQHFAKLSQYLGKTSNQRRAKVPGDMLSFQAQLRDSAGDYYLFGAVRDAPEGAMPDNPLVGMFTQMQGLAGIQMYVGGVPHPGLLKLLTMGAALTQPDAAGYTQLLTGGWMRVAGQYTLFSFQRDVLREVTPQLRFATVAEPAHAWLVSEDLARSKTAGAINNLGYRRERGVSMGNSLFMYSLSEQLHVPAGQGLVTAERILDAKLNDPLGGKYELVGTPGGLQTWISSKLRTSGVPLNSKVAPADYRFPALDWLRGIDAVARFDRSTVSAHAELEMPGQATSKATTTPTVNLPFKFPGFGAPTPAPKPEELPKPATQQF